MRKSSEEVLRAYGFEPDPVIEFYKQRIDRARLQENLKLTPTQRLERLMAMQREHIEASRKAEADEWAGNEHLL